MRTIAVFPMCPLAFLSNSTRRGRSGAYVIEGAWFNKVAATITTASAHHKIQSHCQTTLYQLIQCVQTPIDKLSTRVLHNACSTSWWCVYVCAHLSLPNSFGGRFISSAYTLKFLITCVLQAHTNIHTTGSKPFQQKHKLHTNINARLHAWTLP